VFEPLESRRLLATAPTILFIRGATRSGGFLEGTTAASRDEQLADINNTSTASGNAGWGTLASTLRNAGFAVEQMTEPKEAVEDGSGFTMGRPIHFENLELSKYAAIVFGSNNARYPRASIDAIDSYIHNGGGAIFISDANFGSNWRDAPDSDQQFLARWGLIVNQDAAAGTTTLSRAGGNFVMSDHPVLDGVDSMTGEGVSPLVVPDVPPPGVIIRRVVAATGQTRNNDGVDSAKQYQGTPRNVTDHDAALVLASVGGAGGHVVGYFDRNTFFNANGVGTDITKADNRQFALNLFHYVTDSTPPTVTSSTFTQSAPSELKLTFDDRVIGLTRRDILLRDPFTAEPIPRKRWGWSLSDVSGHSVLSIRIKAAQPAGTYQLQINANHITDDADNPNARLRRNFTIGTSPSPAVVAAAAKPLVADVHRNAQDLFE
jgi:hypothetical protein